MTFVVDLAAAAAAGIIVEQVRQVTPTLRSLVADAYKRYSDGSLGIFVFGPGGAGKTTLKQTLANERWITEPPEKYDSSVENESAKFDGSHFYSVSAAPGQVPTARTEWPRLYERVSQTQNALCIFCFSYGYESPWKRNVPIDKDSKALQTYIAERRAEEVERFAAFRDGISAYRGRIGLITLVTKQDLWWANREAVEAHYASAAFDDILESIKENKEAAGFAHRSCSVSLAIENLRNDARQTLVPVSEGYDQELQLANYANFRRQVDEVLAQLRAN